jgi:serine/threonine protein kinase
MYTVTPVPEGQNLRQWIRSKGPMSVSETRQVLGQLLEALEYAHSLDICHLNLRPEVVFIRQDKELRLCLSGFGAPVRQPQYTEPVYLTMPDYDPQFMAPEQIIGTDVDSRTDIYAFGLLMFFVLTGRTPFEVKRINDTQEIARMQVQVSLPRPSAIRATLPSIVDEVFLKCVSKSVLSRYQSVPELLGDLQGIQSSTVS